MEDLEIYSMATEDKIQTVAVIYHGKRRKSRSLEAALLFLEQNEFNLIILPTEFAGHAKQLARNAQIQQVDCILVGGGDGTFHEIINGLDYSDSHQPILGFIASGTGNDFLRVWQPKFQLESFQKAILTKQTELVDTISIQTETQLFYGLNIADIGFGGYVMNLVNQQRRLFQSTKLAYPLSILRAFVSFQKPILHIQSEQFDRKQASLLLAVCNSSTFGDGIVIHPEANCQDEQLGFTFIGNVSLLDYIKQLGKLKKGIHIQHPEVHYFSGKTVTVKAIDQKAYLEVDGEVYPLTGAATFSVGPKIHLLRFS